MDNKQCNSVPSPGSFMFAQWLWSTLSLPCLFSNIVGGGPGGRSLNTKNRKASIESDTVPPWGGLIVFHMPPLRRAAPPTAAESQGSKSCQVNISSQDYSKREGMIEGRNEGAEKLYRPNWDILAVPCVLRMWQITQYTIRAGFSPSVPSFVTQTAECRCFWWVSLVWTKAKKCIRVSHLRGLHSQEKTRISGERFAGCGVVNACTSTTFTALLTLN